MHTPDLEPDEIAASMLDVLCHMHDYATLTRTETNRRLAILLGVLSATTVGFVSAAAAHSGSLFQSAVVTIPFYIGILAILFTYIGIISVVFPTITDNDSLVNPTGMIKGFGGSEDFVEHVTKWDVAKAMRALAKEVYAEALADAKRQRQLRFIIWSSVVLFATTGFMGILAI